ncbi:MAG: pantetheine-phosphate adenylyltransferase, partial [Gammaproteobacteria bacterium]
THAHQDIVARALVFFDKLIWALGTNPVKQPLFSQSQRLEMLNAIVDAQGWRGRVEPMAYEGATARFALSQGACTLIRGLRSPDDFASEFTQTVANRQMGPGIETLFLMTAPAYAACSSTIVRELLALGESIEPYVPAVVCDYIALESECGFN